MAKFHDINYKLFFTTYSLFVLYLVLTSFYISLFFLSFLIKVLLSYCVLQEAAKGETKTKQNKMCRDKIKSVIGYEDPCNTYINGKNSKCATFLQRWS